LHATFLFCGFQEFIISQKEPFVLIPVVFGNLILFVLYQLQLTLLPFLVHAWRPSQLVPFFGPFASIFVFFISPFQLSFLAFFQL